MSYRLLIDFEVFVFLESLAKKEQLALKNRFIAIREFPANYADYTETDIFGRRVEINIFGKFALKYWIDNADGHVKILDLHFADRFLQ